MHVSGMTCGGCERALAAALRRHPAVESVQADAKTGQVALRVRGAVDEGELAEIVRHAGYRPG
jgi:copper chaperone CopZ